MIIAVTASKPELSSPVDPRFGRAPYFIIVNSDTMEFEAEENTNLNAASGVGIQSAQMIAGKKVDALLTGSCGPNAFQTLQAAGINVVTGVTGTVEEAVKAYVSGRFQSAPQPNVPPHFGMGQGSGNFSGPGMGGGRGSGMGRGMGRGMGMGGGAGRGGVFQQPQPQNAPQTPKYELEYLKQQAEQLRRQLESVTKRIEELE